MTPLPHDSQRRIREQLERIVASTAFSGTERHRRFLRFVVEQALKGDTDKLNEFVLGLEVFNKNESFDPRIDSIVRVEARRLRDRLKKYYDEEGAADPIIVTLRPRSFVPAFDERPAPGAPPPGRLRSWLPSHRMLAIVLGALLAGAVGATIVLSIFWKRPSPPQMASVLVLPFQTLAGQELLGDGLSDSLISGLAGIPGLRVMSRGRAPAALASDLKVDYFIEGTVQSRDQRLIVSAKMTDTHTQSYVWAETRECAADALPALERDLVGSIAGRIRIPRPPGSMRAPRRRAANWEAYANYLKGQYHVFQWGAGNIEKGVALFEQAIQGDPNYAPAWAWLAQSYFLMIQRDDGHDAALIAKGRQAAAKALALDDQLAEAHAAVASYAAFDWNWTEAGKEFHRAVQLNPDWAQGHLLYAFLYLLPTGHTREAAGEAFRARELDPVSNIIRFLGTEILYVNHDYARALAEAEDLRRPGGPPSPLDRVYYLSLLALGQGQRALTEMRAARLPDDDRSPALGSFGYLLARQGAKAEAKAIRERLTSPFSIALVSVGLNDNEEAFRQLRTAANRRLPGLASFCMDPVFDPLRADPRFAELARSMGLNPNLK